MLLRKDTIFVDRPSDSVASPFATLQLYSITVYHTLRHSHALSVRLSHTLWLVFAALVLYISKNGTTFQNCRLIATYHLDESHHPTSFRASTVSPVVVFVLDANTRSCASVALITRLWYMPPPIILFFYTTYALFNYNQTHKSRGNLPFSLHKILTFLMRFFLMLGYFYQSISISLAEFSYLDTNAWYVKIKI